MDMLSHSYDFWNSLRAQRGGHLARKLQHQSWHAGISAAADAVCRRVMVSAAEVQN